MKKRMFAVEGTTEKLGRFRSVVAGSSHVAVELDARDVLKRMGAGKVEMTVTELV